MTASTEAIYRAFCEGLRDPTPPEPLTPIAAELYEQAMAMWRVDPEPARSAPSECTKSVEGNISE